MKKDKLAAIPSLLREINERSALDALRASGPLHAAEVARTIGVSKPTTSEILRSLVESGLVRELEPGADDSKRARTMFEAIADLKVTLGIDIGSRFIRAAVGNLNGALLSEVSQPTTSLELKSLLADIDSVAREALRKAGFVVKDIASVAVGTPGVVDQKTGNVAIAGTIGSLDGVNLAAEIKKLFKVSPIVENDVNMVTVAEQMTGFGRSLSSFAVLSVGSGLGSGLVLGGELHRGHRGAAGEIFYVPFGDPRDRARTATNPSGDRIADLTRELSKKHKKSVLVEPYTTVDILNAAKAGDPLASEVIALEAERIALYIGALSAVTDVELVILSGGIGRQADFFIAPIRELVAQIVPYPPRIEISKLGDHGILVGALQLATSQACNLVFSERTSDATSQAKGRKIS
jgi:predicted NBD/HSP70 family sugar kinase